jgi:two-component system sensor histidine kinase RpfC
MSIPSSSFITDMTERAKRLSIWKKALGERLAGSERPELEQAALRVAIVGLVLLYLIYQASISDGRTAREVAWVAFATFSVSVALLFRILYVGGTSVARRIFGIVVDNAATSYCLLQMEETGAIIIGVYLFVTFGNGFRYGRKYLHLCQCLALLGFGLVIAFSDYWRSHASLSIGLLIALVVLPFYVAVLAQRITEAMLRADEANKAKGRFLANMSHEMRTPLNGVIAMADVLRETPLNQSQSEIVETMTTSAQVLLAQIEDVLDMAKIEAGRVTVERRPFDLFVLLNSIVKVVLPQAGRKGLDLRLHVEPNATCWFEGDPHHLRQVVLNLVSNAVKFTEKGSVTILARLSDPVRNVGVRIEVRDTGVGIAKEKQSLIFEPFTQADNSITRVYGGTGLGTTIARHLVALMGGEIGLESEVGRGTIFWVEIPLSATATPSDASESANSGATVRAIADANNGVARGPRKPRGKRVLVAEDNVTNQRVAQLILESGGHDVTIVDNGECALDRLASGQFDIALFDLSMPVVSGSEALRMYRFTTKSPIPVLILSANVTPDAIEDCLHAGAAEFIPKPLRARQVLDAIDRHLNAIPAERPAPLADEDFAGSATGDEDSNLADLDSRAVSQLCQLSPDAEFIKRLLLGFESDLERLTKEISLALEERKFEHVRDCAHALKGGAASVGARRLATFALSLERATHESLLNRRPQWIAEMTVLRGRVEARIDEYLRSSNRLSGEAR